MSPPPIIIAAVGIVLTSSAACQSPLTPQQGGVDGSSSGETIPVDILTYRPDGSLVLFTEPVIHVFDGTLNYELSAIPLAFPTTPSNAMPLRMRFSLSSDGATAAVSYSSFQDMKPSTIEVFAIPGGELLNRFDFPNVYSIETPALSPDGKLLYAVPSRATPRTPA